MDAIHVLDVFCSTAISAVNQTSSATFPCKQFDSSVYYSYTTPNPNC